MLEGPGQRRARFALLSPLLAAAIASGCATPYDPFRIPAAELRARVHTIALSPLRVSPDAADLAFARAEIEPRVTSILTQAGFQVVSSDAMEDLWRAAASDVGGIYDPVTGKSDSERFDAVRSAVYRDLHAERDVDAILYLSLSYVELYLATPRVTFCATTDRVYWPDGPLERWEHAALVRATCLWVSLVDMEARELYGIRSGIEVVETFARQTLARLPQDQRLRDPARLDEAVQHVLMPLAEAMTGR